MGIVLKQPSEALLAAEAGRVIGEAEKAKEEYRRATEIAERLASVKAQQEMTMFSHQLQLDRAKFDLQFDFQKEQRAKVWELEKMEITSKLDFAKEEKQRAQTDAEYEAGMKYIAENADSFPPGLREKAEFDLAFDKLYKAPAVNYPKPAAERDITAATQENLIASAEKFFRFYRPDYKGKGPSIVTDEGKFVRTATPQEQSVSGYYQNILNQYTGRQDILSEPPVAPEAQVQAQIGGAAVKPTFWQRTSPVGALTYLLGEKTKRVAVQQSQQQLQIAIVKNDEDYNKLPSGTLFIGPDGGRRRKP